MKPLSIVSEGTAKNALMWENRSCGKVIYIGDIQEPEKVNGTCLKAMHVGTMDRGFTAIRIIFVSKRRPTLTTSLKNGNDKRKVKL
jgi:hypothetical protein